ncbi:MAG: urease accessory protein UreE [Spirochaetaceae bacterium]|jgi:urease accessory protein|nr:urease accessory protein UreE [Spirochaetaceae bacterium]
MILVEDVLGSSGESRFAGREADYLDIEWYNIRKKIDRRTSRSGVDVGIRMKEALFPRGWRQGDVVYADEKTVLIVDIIPCPCLSLKPAAEAAALIALGYEIGNRHAPLYYGDSPEELLLPFEEPMKRLLEKLGAPVLVREARLLPEKRVSAAGGSGSGRDHRHNHEDHHEHDGSFFPPASD